MLRFLSLTTATLLVLSSPSFAEKGAKVVDTNNDGVVSKAEAEASVDRQFANVDTNKNDKISKEEFISTFKITEKNIPADMLKKHKGMIEKGGMMRFEKLDTDKSGDLSKAELKSDMNKRHDAMDSNKDGNITKDELESFRKKVKSEMQNKVKERAKAE